MPTDKMPFPQRVRDSGTERPDETFHIQRRLRSLNPILIVEDEYLIAADLQAQIRDDGGKVARLALSVYNFRSKA